LDWEVLFKSADDCEGVYRFTAFFAEALDLVVAADAELLLVVAERDETADRPLVVVPRRTWEAAPDLDGITVLRDEVALRSEAAADSRDSNLRTVLAASSGPDTELRDPEVALSRTATSPRPAADVLSADCLERAEP